MTDLQCPATAVLLAHGTPPPLWLARLPVAGRFAAEGGSAVLTLVTDTADLYRGETFTVSAPAADIAEALRRQGIVGHPPAVVAVDSSGWTLLQDS